MIEMLRKNIMGTASFTGKFEGMRKVQEFIVYPIRAEQDWIDIQSDTRYGQIDLTTGDVTMSKPHAGGAYQIHHMTEGHGVGVLTERELIYLKQFIRHTASANAGTNGIVYCDNSGARWV